MIAIDCFSLALKEGGTKTYLRSLLKAIALTYKNSKITLIVPDLNIHSEDLPNATNITVVKVKMSAFIINVLHTIAPSSYYRYAAYIWEQYYFPREANNINPHTILHPYQICTPYKTKAKKVVVIHDIFHWKYQERYNKLEKKIYNSFLEGCKAADTIITISNTSRDEISQLPGITASKIHVCYEGYNPDYLNETAYNTSAVIKKYKLPSQYILAFNSARIHKNTIGAAGVFNMIKQQHPDMNLVLIGGNQQSNHEVSNYLSKQKLVDSTHYVPFVTSIEDFRIIYSTSIAFLFLSTDEGFGLPPLEALASGGLPIISARSSLRELFSPLLPMYEPDDTSGISEYIHSVTVKPKIKTEAITKAKVLLQKYSWQTILPLYADILSLN